MSLNEKLRVRSYFLKVKEIFCLYFPHFTAYKLCICNNSQNMVSDLNLKSMKYFLNIYKLFYHLYTFLFLYIHPFFSHSDCAKV